MSLFQQQTQTILDSIQKWGGQGDISIVYDSDYYPQSTQSYTIEISPCPPHF